VTQNSRAEDQAGGASGIKCVAIMREVDLDLGGWEIVMLWQAVSRCGIGSIYSVMTWIALI
jgi:hypothetical protein